MARDLRLLRWPIGAIEDWRLARSPRTWVEYRRLQRLPRYVSGLTDLAGPQLTFVDAASFLSAWRAIFVGGIYDLPPHRAPRILDCGANVGLASIRWKLRHADARIDAFEPDPSIAAVLRDNLARCGFGDVAVHEAAVWNRESSIAFQSDGADAGRVAARGAGPTNSSGMARVRTLSLRPWLDEHIDLLKLDIEGSELEVIRDVADRLSNVDRLFVEYHGFAEAPQRLHELLGILSERGFRIYVQSEFAPGRPFLEARSSEGMDLRVNIFALSAPALAARV